MRVLCAVALLWACGSPAGQTPKADGCTKVGQQCKLAKGPLGVCMKHQGGFVCTPQH